MPDAATELNTAPVKAMAPHELLYPDLDHELATTRRMLERVPDGKDDWRPHEKSMTLGHLAGHLAQLPGFGSLMLDRDEFHGTGAGVPPKMTNAERLKVFDNEAAKFRSLMNAMTWEQSRKTWRFMIGDRVGFEGKRGELLRTAALTHMAHHRAQLGVYLRVLGVPIPGSYGPSADEPLRV